MAPHDIEPTILRATGGIHPLEVTFIDDGDLATPWKRQSGQIVVDECHHLGAASFDAILKRTKAKFVLGLTATPIRRDGQQPVNVMQCGPIRHTAARPVGAPHDLELVPR